MLFAASDHRLNRSDVLEVGFAMDEKQLDAFLASLGSNRTELQSRVKEHTTAAVPVYEQIMQAFSGQASGTILEALSSSLAEYALFMQPADPSRLIRTTAELASAKLHALLHGGGDRQK